MTSMTYGVMPTREQFDEAWDRLLAEAELRGGLFHFGNDKRLGTCALTQGELWDEILRAHEAYEGKPGGEDCPCCDGDPGDWLSSVLGCLGFEWI